MAMPNNLILVRHGHSEGNLVTDLSKAGDDSFYTPDFRESPGHSWRLTSDGRKQAKTAGQWISKNIETKFDKYYVSPYVRTRETAALLNLPGAEWRVDQRLRERDWGDVTGIPHAEFEKLYPRSAKLKKADALYARLPGGESIADVVQRVHSFLSTLHREGDGLDIIVVTHGEFMWAFRYLIERMSDEEWLAADKDAKQKIHNTQVIHYSRLDPKTKEISRRVDWVRSVNPSEDAGGDWAGIKRHQFTNQDLLKQVKQVDSLFPDQ